MDLQNSMGKVEIEESMEVRIIDGFGGFGISSLTYFLSTQTWIFLEIKENKRGFLSDNSTQTCVIPIVAT